MRNLRSIHAGKDNTTLSKLMEQNIRKNKEDNSSIRLLLKTGWISTSQGELVICLP